VCDKPVEGEVIEMGHRTYCTDCHAKITRHRQSLWRTSLLGIGGLIAFVAVVALFVKAARPQLAGSGLILAGIVLAIVPALLWLAIFYLQDAQEPEPRSMVLAVFVLGALVAQAVGLPLIDNVFRVSDWITTGASYNLLGSILVVGFIQMFLIYATVRYSVYGAQEFDERMDGIVYVVAAALGYATVVNVQYVVGSGGVDLVAGIIRITVTAMALASFGGLVGYFLGRCKFEDEPVWWMPFGLTLAAVIDGLFVYTAGEVTSTSVGLQGGGYNPWAGLVLGTVVAIVTFAALFYLIQRLQSRAPQSAGA
jgi:RsiW-degrading membrane proteinase PrsW (M82 family)